MARALPELRRGTIREEIKERDYLPPELSDLVEGYDYLTHGQNIAFLALDMLPVKAWPKREGPAEYPWVRVYYADESILEARKVGDNLWNLQYNLEGDPDTLETELDVRKSRIEAQISILQDTSQIVNVTMANGIRTGADKSYNKPDSTYAVLYENKPGQPGYDPELV